MFISRATTERIIICYVIKFLVVRPNNYFILKFLLNTKTVGKHYTTLLTEGGPEFIKEEESTENINELLEMDISKIDMVIAIESLKND